MLNKGVLVELNKEQLKELGGYKKGECFILNDFSETILLLKPENGKKHEYFIPALEKNNPNLPHISFAIYAFLRQEGKNRTELIITQEGTGQHSFFVGDSIHKVYETLSEIIKLNLCK